MEVIIYLLVVCLIIYIVFSLLPIILPLILILVIVASIYIWYMKRKIRKQMDQYDQSSFFEEQSFYDSGSRPMSDDVIDVEYTESEDRSDQ